MAFGKRKKEKEAAKKQQRFETRLTNEQRIEAAIADAEKITDKAEKFFALEKILNDIDAALRIEKKEIDKKVEKSIERIVAYGGGGVSMAAVVGGAAATLTAVVAPPVGAAIMIVPVLPSLFGSIVPAAKRAKAVEKKLETEIKDFLQKMEGFKQLVTEEKETITVYIKDHKGEILRSPFYEQISKLPDLSKEFEGVAAQELAKYEEMQSIAKEAPAKTTPSLTNKPKIVLSRPPQA